MRFEFDGNSNRGGTYRIVNQINGKPYFGSTYKFKQRWNEHRNLLEKGKHGNPHLQGAFNQDGTNAFVFEVLEVISGSKQDRLDAEQLLLDQFWDGCVDCYNIEKKARSRGGRKPVTEKRRLSPEHKRKIGLTKLGNTNMLGKHHTEETRKKLSDFFKGKPNVHALGNTNMRGKKQTDNAKRAISQSQKQRWISMLKIVAQQQSVSYEEFLVCKQNQRKAYQKRWREKNQGTEHCPQRRKKEREYTRMTIKIAGNSTIELGNGLKITFHRTIRIPEDGQTHSLPASLGHFPIKRVEDYKNKVPASWVEHGGVFIPMYQREAMWLAFHADHGKNFALKVATGKVNAISGKKWTTKLKKAKVESGKDPVQDYSVVPGQPWLDGFNTGDGVIRQFVAMPLGMGYTVEGQVTGKEEFGGLQFLAVPAKEGKIPAPQTYGRSFNYNGGFEDTLYSSSNSIGSSYSGGGGVYACSSMPMKSATKGIVTLCDVQEAGAEMGLAAGGKITQKIYADPHGIEVWDQDKGEKVFVHIVNSQMYKQITGEDAPASPITAQIYQQYGYPWFALYDEHVPAVQGSGTLANVKPVSQMNKKKKISKQQDDSKIDSKKHVHKYPVTMPKSKPSHNEVTDGKW